MKIKFLKNLIPTWEMGRLEIQSGSSAMILSLPVEGKIESLVKEGFIEISEGSLAGVPDTYRKD